MAKVLLLLPTGTYRTPDFIDAARSLDLEVVVVTDDTSAPAAEIGTVIVVDFSHPQEAARTIVAAVVESPGESASESASESTGETAQTSGAAAAGETQKADENTVAAVIAVDDAGVLTASLTRQLLGLPGTPPAAVATTRDKAAMRRRFSEAGVRQPDFAVVATRFATSDAALEPALEPTLESAPEGDSYVDPLAAAAAIGFPCVVKPVGLSGSRGVIRVDGLDAVADAVERARSVAAEAGEFDSLLVIESYIDGSEVAVEGIVDDGLFNSLAVFDKPDAPNGPFFEETYYVTPSLLSAEVLDALNRSVASAAAALGIVDGPVHAEARIDSENRIWILELAARSIGGLCSRSLRFGLGVSLETLILRHALHMPVSDLTRESAASGVLMLPIPTEGVLKSVDGQDEARGVFGIQSLEITIPIGRAVRPLPDGDRYLGFMFARGPSSEAVESTLREAHSRLDVVISSDSDHDPGSAP